MIKIIIELPHNYEGWPRGRVKKLKKWLADLSALLSDGAFMNYTKRVEFQEEKKDG